MKKRSNAICLSIEQSRQSRIPKAHIGLYEDETDSLKRKELTGCNMEVVRHKASDANGGMKKVNCDLYLHIFSSYANIRQDVDQLLLSLSS